MESKTDDQVISIFKETKALLTGHFILRSGQRSGHFFQCAQVCQYLDKVSILASLLIKQLDCPTPNTIVAPAMGGLVLGQEVARQLNCRFLFLEKVEDKLELRRNFSLSKKDNVLLVEDVVTKGGRVTEALSILNETECTICAVTSLVDRSTHELDFGVSFQPLLKLNFPTYDPSEIPDELKLIDPIKPGS